MKRFIRGLLPAPVLLVIRRLREKYRARRLDVSFAGKDPSMIFSSIYKNNWWGSSDCGEYMSGHGSRDPKYVSSYLDGVRGFIEELPEKPTIVDLGCGDFYVGSQLIMQASKYIACDVVDSLIESHKLKYIDPGVEFRVVDITRDSIPDGRIAIVRQVLQHLSNDQIHAFLDKISQSSFSYLIVAEYIPKRDFVSNIDQPCGAHSRIARGINSGVVLTDPPFNFCCIGERVLAEAEDATGLLRTIVYQLK